MKLGLFLPLLLIVNSAARAGQAQAPAPAPAPPATPKPHGPEAVASQDPNRIVATVDGQKITAKQVMEMLKGFPAEQRKQIDANLTTAVQQIYMQQQLAEAANKLNLEQQSPWKEQLELNRRGVLARAYVAHLSDEAAKGPGDDPQKYYDEHKAEFDSVKLSGIFVGFNAPGTPASSAGAHARTEEQAHEKANDIEKKLAAGGDFAALARTESEHQTASKGGDLGTVPINDPQVQIPADIKAAVAKLQPGQTSEPVRIQGAFLIVKLDTRETVPFDRAKAGIEQKLQTERSQDVVKKETEKYTIHVEDQDFFDTGATPSNKVPSLQRPKASAQPKP
jgi:parvulin-like peptidyl-prolyl isomerase